MSGAIFRLSLTNMPAPIVRSIRALAITYVSSNREDRVCRDSRQRRSPGHPGADSTIRMESASDKRDGYRGNDWIKLRPFDYRIQCPSDRSEEFFPQPNSLAFIPTKRVI
jgi:hypothetical protein